MIRNYRPPENIINEYYDTKADMWNLGCLLYEFATNEFLFNVDIESENDNFYRDRHHLSLMFEYLGEIDNIYVRDCDFKNELFNKNGKIKEFEKINKNNNLEKLLKNHSTYEDKDLTVLNKILKRLLEYNPEKRISAYEILSLFVK